jgi:hypothetical protein
MGNYTDDLHSSEGLKGRGHHRQFLKVAATGKPAKIKKVVDKPESTYEEKECNGRLLREIAEDMQLTIAQVDDITKHYAGYIADTIRSGSLAGVTVPYLGKFQVKLHSQQYKDYLHSLGKDMKKYFKKNPDAMKLLTETEEE